MGKSIKYESKQLFVIDCIKCSKNCMHFHKDIVYTNIKEANKELKNLPKHAKVITLEEMISDISDTYY